MGECRLELTDCVHAFAFNERGSSFYPVHSSCYCFSCDLDGAVYLKDIKSDLKDWFDGFTIE
jgi:hypothetical protein